MKSTDGLVFRDTDVLPLSRIGQDFILPERLRISLNQETRKAPLDIGAFAYSKRSTISKAKQAHLPIAVDVSSLLPLRRDLVRGIADYFFSNGYRDKTIVTDFKNFRFAIDWCDDNGHSGWVKDADSASAAYSEYSDFLRHSILVTGTLKPGTCSERQRAFQKLVEVSFPNQSLHIVRGVPMIKATRTPKKPPEEDAVKHYVKVCLDLANNLSDFILNEKPFPFKMEVAGSDVVLFPSNVGVITPFTDPARIPRSYDVANLKVANIEEVIARGGKKGAAQSIKDTQKALDGANSDPRCIYRMLLASLAAGAYSCLFSLITAANPSEFIQFEFLDALEIEKSMVKKEFTSVKFRANGKTTRYAIGRRSGLDLLRSYLKLREWILNGAECKYLFFTPRRVGNYTGDYSQLDDSFSYKFFKRLKGIYISPNAGNIPGGIARKLKSLVLHELRVSPSSVAEALNHTSATNAKSYSETTVSRQKKEFGTFWSAVRKAAEAVRDRPQDARATSISVGHCDDFSHPIRILEAPAIEPNCRTQYGCLFCENYVCHADQEDAHKLLSLQYVVTAVRDLSASIDHAESLFKEISVRIDLILEEISKRSEKNEHMITALARRVKELGELTPFWENRLQRYEKMGVVF